MTIKLLIYFFKLANKTANIHSFMLVTKDNLIDSDI